MGARRKPRIARTADCRWRLPAELVKRLIVHSAVTGEKPAAVVAALVDTHIPRYVVQTRGAGGGEGAAEGEGSAGEAA